MSSTSVINNDKNDYKVNFKLSGSKEVGIKKNN